jgi:hypothetical protein
MAAAALCRCFVFFGHDIVPIALVSVVSLITFGLLDAPLMIGHLQRNETRLFFALTILSEVFKV